MLLVTSTKKITVGLIVLYTLKIMIQQNLFMPIKLLKKWIMTDIEQWNI